MVERDSTAKAPGAAGAPVGEIFQTEASWSISSGDMLCLRTGDWRTERPVFDKEECNACGFCYIFCPIQCIHDDEDGIHYAADMEYCKGCGVCAKECPTGAIVMTPEGGFDVCS
jgi:pyruvate ferredoxin oxidoreductase delta subunit